MFGAIMSPVILLFIRIISGLFYTPPNWALKYQESIGFVYTPNWTKAFTDFFIYIYPISFIGVVIYGIPVYLLLRYFNYDNYFAIAILGFAGGAAFGALAAPIIYSMLFYGGCGFAVASSFWFFSVYAPSRLFNITSSNK